MGRVWQGNKNTRHDQVVEWCTHTHTHTPSKLRDGGPRKYHGTRTITKKNTTTQIRCNGHEATDQSSHIPTTMWHAQHNALHTGIGCHIDHGLQARNQGFTAFQTKALSCGVLLRTETLKVVRPHQAIEDAHFFILGQHGFFHRFKLELQQQSSPHPPSTYSHIRPIPITSTFVCVRHSPRKYSDNHHTHTHTTPRLFTFDRIQLHKPRSGMCMYSRPMCLQ
jgi:hypothetical protein